MSLAIYGMSLAMYDMSLQGDRLWPVTPSSLSLQGDGHPPTYSELLQQAIPISWPINRPQFTLDYTDNIDR